MSDSSGVPQWLQTFDDRRRKERVWKLGLLTGWRRYADGSYGAPNFERALVLDRIVELYSPKMVLEIGTGRGLGSLAVRAAAEEYGCNVTVTTVDVIPPDRKQEWAIRIEGEDKVIEASRNQIWSRYLDASLHKDLTQLTGFTTTVLPRLSRDGKTFDFIFIDGGHDIYSVINDLSYAITLLNPGGMILMDDFAPLDEFGVGTIIAVHHAKRRFDNVEVFRTEGLVFGGAERPGYPRGMAFLSGLKRADNTNVSPVKFLFWKFLKAALWFAYRNRSFPLR